MNTDLDEKHTLICRRIGGGGPLFTLLWRNRPLPKVGDVLHSAGFDVIVEGTITMSDEPDGLLCWLCPKCETMGLVREAVAAGYCMQQPRRPDCPVPLSGMTIAIVEAP